MLGPAFLIIGALAFLCVHPSSAITQIQANGICALLPDGESIANPDDCTQYFSCTNGKAFLHSCLGRNLYSKESQGCVPPNQASCGSIDVDPCENMADGYFASVRNSCKEFYYCENGKGVKSSCGKLNFDEGHQSCQFVENYPCSENIPGDGNINICDAVRSGIYFGDASSCSAWQKCQINGPLEIDDCPSPYVFNVDTRSCDWKENYNCRQLQGDSGTGRPSLEGQACNTNGEVRPGPTCAGYYVCTNGKYQLLKCINGLYFNTKTNKCASRLDAINDCDRCEGTKLTFVNLMGDGCTGYGVCENGKMQSVDKCPTGYFSELSGGCIRNGKNPGFPVCQLPEEEPSTTEPPTVPPTDEATDAPSATTEEEKTVTKDPETEKPEETTAKESESGGTEAPETVTKDDKSE